MLAAAQAVGWVPWCTDPPKLRSLILFPAHYPQCTLYTHPEGAYALSHELLQPPGEQYARFTLYGNLQAAAPDYCHAAEQLLRLPAPSSIRGSAIPEAAVEPVTRVLQAHGWRRTYCDPCLQFCVAGAGWQHEPSAGPCMPPGYEIDTLQRHEAPLVDSVWAYRSQSSLAMIEGLIGSSHTSCVRLQDGQPVAWMLEVEPLCGGMLHVVGEHRRQGLAKAVAWDLLSKLQAKWLALCEQQPHAAALAGDGPGHGVYCYVASSNTPSRNLMQALQLSQTGVFTWLGFEKAANAV